MGKEEETIYQVPMTLTERRPFVDGMNQYRALYEDSIENSDAFWLNKAKELLHWDKEPTVAFKGDFASGANMSWFGDGRLNVAFNCLDRHVEAGHGSARALIWEGDDPLLNKTLTFAELLAQVSQFSNYLESLGVGEGDRVAVYLPMVPEAVVVMLACARVGAMHNVVFAGFSAEALKERIEDSKPKLLVTADEGLRGGKIIHLKQTVDNALLRCAHPLDKILVVRRTGATVPMRAGRDSWFEEEVAKMSTRHEARPFPADNLLFMLYTSGSTGRPKGLVHASAGYLLYSLLTLRTTFDLRPAWEGDVFGCLADIGWVTGHSYIVYGPLALGATTVLFESTPTWPTPSRYWQLTQRWALTHLYTAPTVIRALMRHGATPLEGYDLSSLKVIGTVGEPIGPDAWRWYWHHVGGAGRAAVVDTYWQTETGGHLIAPMAGATLTKAGSATFPVLGISIAVLDELSGKELGLGEGVLTVTKPWPGLARGIWRDSVDEHGQTRFYRTYFQPYAKSYFTGDRVFRDSDGYLWIRGRVDDVLNVSGHRLSTAEIEGVLGKHSVCAEAAVLGRPDAITGEAIWAFCVKRHDLEIHTEKELKALVKEAIGGFAVPQRILLVDDLPKTRSGKIMRRLIRKILHGVRTIDELGDLSTLQNPASLDTLIRAVEQAEKLSKI